MKKFSDKFKFVASLFIGLTIVSVFYNNLRFNFTDSMPKGLYWRSDRLLDQLIVGDDVEVCLPPKLAQFGKARGYLRSGSCENNIEPILKRVIALGGDRVLLSQEGIEIYQNVLPHSQTNPTDSKGRAMPAIARGEYILKPNEVWLMGVSCSHSWDSRYYGPIDRRTIQMIVYPVLTAEHHP